MSILIMLLLLSILILVHEAGHFLAARFFKIKVDKFGFGLPIGPTLYETQWGDTKILIHAFLLGGYVSFPDDEKDCELDKDSPKRFSNKPIYQRAIVVSAGVISNVICAFVLVFLSAALWGHLPSGKYNVYVEDIVAPKNESVWQSGLEKNDRIVEVNGSKLNNTYALFNFIKLSKTDDGKVSSNLITDRLIELKKLNPALLKNEIIPPGVAVKLPELKYETPIMLDDKMLKGMKKYKKKEVSLSNKQKELRDKLKGKTIYISEGEYTINDLSYAIADNSHPLNIKVERDNKIVKLKPLFVSKDGQIGIKLKSEELIIPTQTPFAVIKTGTKYLCDNTYMLLYGLYQIFTGQIPLKDLHGIVVITKVGSDIISNNGLFSGLLLTAIISMDLAIINFLPIPALDGGHIMFLIIEKLRGKPVDEEVLEKVGNTGFWFLIMLMCVVIFNDIFALITKKF